MQKQLVLLLNRTVHLSVETSIYKHKLNLTDMLHSAKKHASCVSLSV